MFKYIILPLVLLSHLAGYGQLNSHPDTALPAVPVMEGHVAWQVACRVPLAPGQSVVYRRLREAIQDGPFTVTAAEAETGTILGTGTITVPVGDSGKRYLLRFHWAATANDSGYRFRATHFFEKPIALGTTSEYTKIEYRWWDFRHGHPWSPFDAPLFAGLVRDMTQILDDLFRSVNSPRPKISPRRPLFRVLAFFSRIVEPDHVDFANDAIHFYEDLATRRHFSFDTTSDWNNCDSALTQYQLVLWLNDFPHTESQRGAFQRYMEQGGAWLGFHVSGYNDKDTHWPWFVRFIGGAVFYNNSWPPLPAVLIVDDARHPVTHRLPSRYIAPINEWYGWRPDPRTNRDVKVLVTLDPANFPLGKKDILRGGDVPVVWTNTKYRMLYLNMGHGDQNFASPTQNRLFENALLWLGRSSTSARREATDRVNP